jgi:hypothetical protein
MPSADEIDDAIMAAVSKHWRKVAMVIVTVSGKGPGQADRSEYDDIAARIEALIQQGKLQCQGNPKRWRRSEVRLPQEGPDRRHYVATVAVAFPALKAEGPNEYDLYEMDVLFESDNPEQALKDAIAISKKSPTWRGHEVDFGNPPVFHAIKGIQPRYPHHTLPGWHDPQEWFPVHVATINQEALETLKTGGEIEFWYGFAHVDGQ